MLGIWNGIPEAFKAFEEVVDGLKKWYTDREKRGLRVPGEAHDIAREQRRLSRWLGLYGKLTRPVPQQSWAGQTSLPSWEPMPPGCSRGAGRRC